MGLIDWLFDNDKKDVREASIEDRLTSFNDVKAVADDFTSFGKAVRNAVGKCREDRENNRKFITSAQKAFYHNWLSKNLSIEIMNYALNQLEQMLKCKVTFPKALSMVDGGPSFFSDNIMYIPKSKLRHYEKIIDDIGEEDLFNSMFYLLCNDIFSGETMDSYLTEEALEIAEEEVKAYFM